MKQCGQRYNRDNKLSLSSLTTEDLKWLNAHYPDAWELVSEGDNSYLIIRNFNLPSGYQWLPFPGELPGQHNTREFMLVIPASYPATPLEMFYLCPSIRKINHQPINALHSVTHLDKKWQCWSRHYPWQAGVDNVATHINNMKEVLALEGKA